MDRGRGRDCEMGRETGRENEEKQEQENESTDVCESAPVNAWVRF